MSKIPSTRNSIIISTPRDSVNSTEPINSPSANSAVTLPPSSFGVGVRSIARSRSSSLIVAATNSIKDAAIQIQSAIPESSTASAASSSGSISVVHHRLKLHRSPMSTAFIDSRVAQSRSVMNPHSQLPMSHQHGSSSISSVTPSLSEMLLKRSRDPRFSRNSLTQTAGTGPLKAMNVWKACQIEYEAELNEVQSEAKKSRSSSQRRFSIAELQLENKTKAERNPSLLPVLPKATTIPIQSSHHNRYLSVSTFPSLHPLFDRPGSEILKPMISRQTLLRVSSPMGQNNFDAQSPSDISSPILSRTVSDDKSSAAASPSPDFESANQTDELAEIIKSIEITATPFKSVAAAVEPPVFNPNDRNSIPIPTSANRLRGSSSGLIPLDSHQREVEREESEFEDPIAVVDYSKLHAFFLTKPTTEENQETDECEPAKTSDAIMGYVNDRYSLKNLIGEGNFGSVYDAEPIESDMKKHGLVAIKLQHGDKMQKGDAINELNVMAKLNEIRKKNPNAIGANSVIEMFDHAYIEDESGDWSSFIAMPLAYSSLAREKSDLSDAGMRLVSDQPEFAHLIERGDAEVSEGIRIRNLAWTRIKKITKSLLEALDWLHSNGIVHADIKLENLLLIGADSTDLDNSSLILADFGLACEFSESNPELFFAGVVGTPVYQSPESWKGICGPATDIWSFAISILELSTGFTPLQISLPEPRLFEAWEDSQLRVSAQEFSRHHYSEFNFDENFIPNLYSSLYLDSNFLSFIQLCLNPARFQRPTAKQLLEHPFLL